MTSFSFVSKCITTIVMAAMLFVTFSNPQLATSGLFVEAERSVSHDDTYEDDTLADLIFDDAHRDVLVSSQTFGSLNSWTIREDLLINHHVEIIFPPPESAL